MRQLVAFHLCVVWHGGDLIFFCNYWGGLCIFAEKQADMRYGLLTLLLFVCGPAFSQTIVGEAPEVAPEFTLTPP